MVTRRNTVQREIILTALLQMDTHPSVEEVYLNIQENHPSISKMTVYRNLRRLAEEGVIRQISLPGDLERYDGSDKQHYHFKCRRCAAIINVDIDCVATINEEVQGKYKHQVDYHEVVFTGVCNKCKAASGEAIL